MIRFSQKGDFSKTEKMLEKALGRNYRAVLEKYGRQGVSALSAATPKDSGMTAASWGYEISIDGNGMTVNFTNTHINKGVNIALILQYGHGTRNGGYVQGRDYINPAARPIFDKMAQEAWKEVIGNG